MNKAEKQAAAESLRNEATVLRQTRENYKEARANIEQKLKVLADREQTKSVIWQKQYQESLKQQLDTAIDVLSTKNYSNIRQYLEGEYENGFIGTMYSMQKQGIPLAMPIDQKRVVQMVETTGDNMKLSKKLYGNTTKLKNAVRREVSIGFASGESYEAVAGRLSRTMGVDYNQTIRIARTEGGRVQNASRFDAMTGAKKNGADIVKQWDSTLDNVTRPAHRELDGQIRELDEMFEAEGQQAQHPHGFGVAWMDINCRCVVVQRARWAIDGSNPDFEQYTKWDRNAPIRISEDGKSISQLIDLSDAKNFNAFKARYKEVSNNLTQQLAAAQIGIEVFGSAPEVAEVTAVETGVVSNEVKNAVEEYVSGDMMYINQQLSGIMTTPMNESEKRFVKLLDKATENKLEKNVTLYRSVDANAIFGKLTPMQREQLSDALVYGDEFALKKVQPIIDRALNGNPIVEKGFMSTTTNQEVALDFWDFTGADMPVVLEFENTKGIGAFDLKKNMPELNERMEQDEILLQRNLKYRIKKMSTANGQIYFKCEFIK